jgi:hypothetical protein
MVIDATRPVPNVSAGYAGATKYDRRGIGFSGVTGFAFFSSGPISCFAGFGCVAGALGVGVPRAPCPLTAGAVRMRIDAPMDITNLEEVIVCLLTSSG